MRLTLAAIALTALTTDGALASSFTYVTQTPGANSPSFITVAPPKALAAASSIAVAETMTGDEKARDLVPLAYPLPQGGADLVRMVSITPSIVAFESAAPAVTFEKVAAIKPASKAHLPTPMVMRGGEVGGPFGTAQAETETPAKPVEKAATEPVEVAPPKTGGATSGSDNGAYKGPDSKAVSNSGAPPQPNPPSSPEQPQAAAQPSTGTRKTSAPQ